VQQVLRRGTAEMIEAMKQAEREGFRRAIGRHWKSCASPRERSHIRSISHSTQWEFCKSLDFRLATSLIGRMRALVPTKARGPVCGLIISPEMCR